MEDNKKPPRRRYPSVVWPVILITAGVLFLLSNFGYLDLNFSELWRLWPLLLILMGLDIILGRRSVIGNIIVLLITIAVIVGVVLFLIASPGLLGLSPAGAVEHFAEPLAGVAQADLEVNFAAGQLNITRLIDSPSLIEADLELVTSREPAWTIDRRDDRAEMLLEYVRGDWIENWNWRGGDRWNLRLSPEVALSLDVDVGAGGATISLIGLNVQDLQVESGAGHTKIIFPPEGDFSGQISGGVGAVVLEIPVEMAARLRIDRGLSALDISSRFTKENDVYRTADWETNPNRVDLDVDVGVGLLTIRDR